MAFYGSCFSVGGANGCDHSAKVISPTLFESKWGAWPRYQHAPADCPYVSSNIQYYEIPLTGASIVCSSPSQTFTTLNISGASYSWSATNLSLSGSGYNPSAVATTFGTLGTLEVSITSPYSGTTVNAKRAVTVGIPNKDLISAESGYSGSGQTVLAPYNETEIFTSYFGPGTILENDVQIWDHSDWSVNYGTPSRFLLDYWYTPTPSSQAVYIRKRNTCGWSLYKETNWTFSSFFAKYTVSPNPASSDVALSFEKLTDPKGLPKHIELLHESSTIPARSLKVTESDFEGIKNNRNKLSLDVSGLPRGVYYLHVNYGDKNKSYMHRVLLQ